MSEILFYKDEYDDEKFIDATDDFIIAKGGDGTLLKAINKFKHLKKPFFGIAAGTKNFLMNESKNISKNAKFKNFRLIKIKVTFIEKIDKDFTINVNNIVETRKVEEYQAFNDICYGGDMDAWISFNVQDKDKIIGKFKGGGVIISTAQGSTGINKNNNGVILPLSSCNWSITGDKCNRKIHYVIESKKTTIISNSRKPVSVWVDGSNHIISNVEKIEISKGDKVTVIFNNYEDFKRKRRF